MKSTKKITREMWAILYNGAHLDDMAATRSAAIKKFLGDSSIYSWREWKRKCVVSVVRVTVLHDPAVHAISKSTKRGKRGNKRESNQGQ